MKFKILYLCVLISLLTACGGPDFSGSWSVSGNMSIGSLNMKSDGSFMGTTNNPPSGTYKFKDGVLIFHGQDYWGNQKEWIYTDIKFIDDDTVSGKNTYGQNISMRRQ